MKKTKLMLGDNIESLKKLPDNSVDSVVTDPPYALVSIKKRFGKENSAPAKFGTDGAFQRASKGFMGKEWDAAVPTIEFWTEIYRVLKPGGHILSFGGTRTYHRMAINIEDAGFEIRDQIQWIYGSGFPKSHNIGKAVDKLEGNERTGGEVKTRIIDGNSYGSTDMRWDVEPSKGTSPYEGWGTALKPANEPICVARKPLSEKSVAENVLKWGTGGINVDGCRIGTDDDTSRKTTTGGFFNSDIIEQRTNGGSTEGRFPANIILECICDDSIIHDDPNCPCRLLDEQSGEGKSTPFIAKNTGYVSGSFTDGNKRGFGYDVNGGYSDKGGASRFFYQAKVSKAERNMGLDGFEEKIYGDGRKTIQADTPQQRQIHNAKKNFHPTVKPINLMAYLCRLITPEGGIVLDPFMGSGSTGVASQLEGFKFIGMEMDPEYFKIAEARIDSYEKYNKFIK